jgi:hypothetical protein
VSGIVTNLLWSDDGQWLTLATPKETTVSSNERTTSSVIDVDETLVAWRTSVDGA